MIRKTLWLLWLLCTGCTSSLRTSYLIKLERPSPQALENLSRALSIRLQEAAVQNFSLQPQENNSLQLLIPESSSLDRGKLEKMLQPPRLAFARVDEKAEFLQSLRERLPEDGSLALGCETTPSEKGGQIETCFLLANNRSRLERFLAELTPPPGRKLAVLSGEWGAMAYLLADPPALEVPQVEHAAVIPQPDGRPEVLIVMPADQKEAFARLTREMVGRSLAIVVDGEIRSLSRVTLPIDSGIALIGSSPLVPIAVAERQAQSLAAFLAAWKLAGKIILEP